MRNLVVLFASTVALALHAQSWNDPVLDAPPGPSPAQEESFEARSIWPPGEPLLTLKLPKPNEIISPRFTYSGIAIQLLKTDNPLQLINPLAPAEYGFGEDNVARDPVYGRVSGLKIFSISF